MLRRLLIVLLSLVLLVVAAVGGTLALLAFDADLIKGPSTRLISARLGREVTIAGPTAAAFGHRVVAASSSSSAPGVHTTSGLATSTHGVLASAMPIFAAAPNPRLLPASTTVVPSRPAARPVDPSVEPLSTTITPGRCRAADSRVSRKLSR